MQGAVVGGSMVNLDKWKDIGIAGVERGKREKVKQEEALRIGRD